MNCTVIIPAAGSGQRFGGDLPKQYINLQGMPVLIHTLKMIDSIAAIQNTVIAIDPEWISFIDNKLYSHKIKKYPTFVKGGKQRQDSIYNALKTELVSKSDIILVHDAVRPLASKTLFDNIINATIKFAAAIPVLTPKETIKLIDNNGFVEKTINRTMLRTVQTPQGFKKDILYKAYKISKEKGFIGTDDASLVEAIGSPVKVIEGEEENIKITTQYDMKNVNNCLLDRIKRDNK